MTSQVEIQFHGTNGWFDSDVGCTSCISIHTGDTVYIFDAGTGIRRLDPFAIEGKSVVLFLSHLHLDHCVGLHFLQRFNPRCVRIITPCELTESAKLLIGPPFSSGFAKSPYPVSIEGVRPGEYEGSTTFSAHRLVHSTVVLGYRLRIGDRVFSYCVDTEVCSGLSAAAAGADIFVCECGLKQGQCSEQRNHLTPEEGISVAAKARVGCLVLTHFGYTRYASMEERTRLLCLSDRLPAELLIAYDGMRLTL